MWLKWLFDKVVAILVKVKIPGGPAFLCRRGLVRVESCLVP